MDGGYRARGERRLRSRRATQRAICSRNACVSGPAPLTAWCRFGDLTTGYGMLRTTAAALTGPVTRDDSGLFAEWREPPSDPRLFGEAWRGRNMRAGTTPWPTEPRARLVWLVRSGLSVWVPTAAERDARWLEEYKTPVPLLGGSWQHYREPRWRCGMSEHSDAMNAIIRRAAGHPARAGPEPRAGPGGARLRRCARTSVPAAPPSMSRILRAASGQAPPDQAADRWIREH